jgi:adenylosuccinate lyase
VDAGLSRDDAYRLVQEAAAAAWDGEADFRTELTARAEVAERLSTDELEALFDPARYLRNLDVVFDRLAKLSVSEDL